MPRTDRAADFAAVDRRLREILEPYRAHLAVTKDGPDVFSLEFAGLEGKPWGYVAGVQTRKSYVSFYLMPMYAQPALVEKVSPELRRRMQGKACFNFTRVDEGLFTELASLVATGIQGYELIAKEMAAKRTPARSS